MTLLSELDDREASIMEAAIRRRAHCVQNGVAVVSTSTESGCWFA